MQSTDTVVLDYHVCSLVSPNRYVSLILERKNLNILCLGQTHHTEHKVGICLGDVNKKKGVLFAFKDDLIGIESLAYLTANYCEDVVRTELLRVYLPFTVDPFGKTFVVGVFLWPLTFASIDERVGIIWGIFRGLVSG